MSLGSVGTAMWGCSTRSMTRETRSRWSLRGTSRSPATWPMPISGCGTNRLATLTSCGPGSANLVMALAVAQTDSSAFLAITANVPTSQFNRGPFQEINRHNQADFPNVIRPVVKHSFQPSRVEMLPLALRQAATTMLSGRPGPVNVDVPFNLFQEEAAAETEAPSGGLNLRRSGASPEDVARAVDMILAARRPVLFIGHGVTLSEASGELTELAHRLSIPVISSPNGMGCIDMGDPLSLGFIGRNGVYPANQAGRHADLVIAVGARFDDRSASSWLPGYSWNFPNTELIHVDVDHAELGRNYPPTLGILADARTFLRQVMAEVERRDRRAMDGWPAGARRSRPGGRSGTTSPHPAFEVHASPLRPERVVADCRAVSAGRCGDLARFGRPPQLVHAVLGGAPSPDHAQYLGLLRHGLWRRRHSRRQARRSRPALRFDLRRRWVHHGAARPVHGGRVRYSGGLGGMEQLLLERHPRHSIRFVRRARDRHRLLSGRQQATLQSRFRCLGPRRWRGGHNDHQFRGLQGGARACGQKRTSPP